MPISCSRPCVRQRASGRAGSSRLATTICDPAGTYSINAARTSRQDGFVRSVQVVEHQHQRVLGAASALPRRGTRVDQIDAARAGQRVEHLGRERLHAVERGRDVPQEQHGVVVPAVERDPRERTRIRFGPPRQQGRLAVPGGRDHGRERQRRRAQARDHVGLRHGAGADRGAASFASTRPREKSTTAIAGEPIPLGARPGRARDPEQDWIAPSG